MDFTTWIVAGLMIIVGAVLVMVTTPPRCSVS